MSKYYASDRYNCVDGRRLRHDPQPDDPYLETDIGRCPECNGKGCQICECCGRLLEDGECEFCNADRDEGEKFAEKHGLPEGIAP